MPHPDRTKPKGQSIHEEAGAFREWLGGAITNGFDGSAEHILSGNAAAMVFSQSTYEVWDQMQLHHISLILTPEANQVHVILLQKGSEKGSVDMVRAMHDEDYRTTLLLGWYKRLAKAFQNPDALTASYEGSQAFKEFRGPLGLVQYDAHHPMPTMFDLAYDSSAPIFPMIADMSVEAEVSALFVDDIPRFIYGLWNILEYSDPITVSQNEDIAPQRIFQNAGNAGRHEDW